MNELLPCPFCGGEAEVVEGEYGMYMTGYAVYCKGTCGAKLGVTGRLCESYEWTPYFDTEAEAIAAWNSRADYHGYEQAAIEAWESIKAWNSRAERTCHNVSTTNNFRCSECDAADLDFDKPSYCHGCGCKVVGE